MSNPDPDESIQAIPPAPDNSGVPAGFSLVHFLADRSGSMAGMANDLINGYNAYLDGLPASVFVAMSQFDSGDNTIETMNRHRLVPVAEAVRLNPSNYQARGGTPLYDSLARVIVATEEWQREIEQRTATPSQVMIVVFTDGAENESREYRLDSINALIKAQEAKGWTFMYMGAAADAWQNEAMFAGTTAGSNVYRSAGAHGMSTSMAAASASSAAWSNRPVAAYNFSSNVVNNDQRTEVAMASGIDQASIDALNAAADAAMPTPTPAKQDALKPNRAARRAPKKGKA